MFREVLPFILGLVIIPSAPKLNYLIRSSSTDSTNASWYQEIQQKLFWVQCFPIRSVCGRIPVETLLGKLHVNHNGGIVSEHSPLTYKTNDLEVSFMNGFLTFPKGSAEVDFKCLALIHVKHRNTLCEVLLRNATHLVLWCTTGLKSPVWFWWILWWTVK